jgi:hypothetical protein
MINNKYIQLLLFTIIITLISIYNEYNNKFIHDIKEIKNLFKYFILRLLHIFIIIYNISFLFLFNYTDNVNVIIYLIFILVEFCHWSLFDACLLSYHELKCYNIDYKNYKTDYHPSYISIFNNNDKIAKNISGLIIIVNILIILYYNKNINISTKKLYLIFFIYLILILFKSKNSKYYNQNNIFFNYVK